MSDDLERLVDERARAVVAEDKAAAARAEAQATHRARHEELREVVDATRFALERNRRWQRESWSRPSRLRLGIFAVLLGVLALGVHYVVFPVVHWTPASLVCPLTCPGCSASMRTLSRHTASTGTSTSESDFTYVCRTDKIDVDRLTLADVEGARRDEIAPFTVNGFLVALVETVFSLIFLVPYLRWRGRRSERREERLLAARLAEAEAQLAAFEGHAPGVDAGDPYR